MAEKHPEHVRLLAEIKRNSGDGSQHSSNDSYLLSGHHYYDVSVPVRRAIAKQWMRAHKDIACEDFLALLDSLYAGDSHEEKTMASILLGYHKVHRASVRPVRLDTWLNHLVGWAEVDALCQNVFTAEELLKDWHLWEAQIRAFARDENIHKRRASLVLLTGPTHRSKDVRLSRLAFAMISELIHEKPILITKAISWLLREMVLVHKDEVMRFIQTHEHALPKIALRETRRKIETGRK